MVQLFAFRRSLRLHLRWHCVRLPSSYPPLRLRHGLITAQGGMPAAITPAIMHGITPIIVIIIVTGIWRGSRAGSAAWRRCRRAALPIPKQA